MSNLKVEFNLKSAFQLKQVQLNSLQINFSSEFSCDCLSAKDQKTDILLLMFSRKLGQKVCDGGEFKCGVGFN